LGTSYEYALLLLAFFHTSPPGGAVKSESLFQYLDNALGIGDFPDYPNALNGLQVEGPEEVSSVCAAVDATEASIQGAVEKSADLLLVHHGLFWGGLVPVTGPLYRRLGGLLEGGVALYAAHLPLDAHPTLGNCAILARELEVEVKGRFGSYQGVEIGWWGEMEMGREAFGRRISEVVGGPVRTIAGGPEEVGKIGVVTGGGGGHIAEAATKGLDTLVTGEGAHHTYFEAMEYGVNVFYAGHYATETWGVRALAAHLEERFDLPWTFLDLPTGM
jgi:dinuclear metal center YbgI/SA1388 family protein